MASSYADWLQRGRVHQRERRPLDAIPCFQRAAALEPQAADPRYLLGEVHWRLGAIPAAVAAWRDAARVDAKHLASRLALAEAFGYRRWTPPVIDAPAASNAQAPVDESPAGGLRDTARRFRRTLVGRALYRVMPPRAVDLLKARLR